jgi:hypothetical protein
MRRWSKVSFSLSSRTSPAPVAFSDCCVTLTKDLANGQLENCNCLYHVVQCISFVIAGHHDPAKRTNSAMSLLQ